MEQSIFYSKTENIATIYLNRPDKKNAVTLDMWKEIPKILAELEYDREVTVVIIRGINDNAFSAGADITEFTVERGNENRAMNYDNHLTLAGDALEYFPKPLIAMVEGTCIGGGCEIALACDLRFSSETGVFGITPAKIGLVYGVPQTKRLVQVVGASRAKDILFSSRFIQANEAYNIALIDRVYKSDEIVDETYKYARLLSGRSQTSIKGSKKIIQSILNESDKDQEEIDRIILNSYLSPDIKEGVAAFTENRSPNFSL
ncbi:enoyl-CoA hydratase-related protein [Salicibibacter kimchii]|uniref:Enoyl-CoA hydratase n=1 Tax=Salicibibacter kimchii TaxID=2099786 RepID=A0A345BWE1_9BACI|nr:enoyl-CoA hydratase-related protein [Salicibibacter kimchii]AXF55272.1 enoyl-CoA hydratase [Salicibibacter kimchii]